MSEFKSSTKTGHNELPLDVRKMLQRRKYILRIEKCKKDGHHLAEIRVLNKSIKTHFAGKRRDRVYALLVSPLFDLTQLTKFCR